MNMDAINGSLAEFRRFREGTFQHLDQVVGAFEVGSDGFHTADGYGYFVDNGRAKLAVVRGEYNPFLHAIKEQGFERVKQQVENNGAYWIKPGKAKADVSAKSTEVFDLEGLGGVMSKDDWGGYGIHIEHWTIYSNYNYDQVITNLEQKRFMQRLGLDSIGINAVLETGNHFCQTHIQFLSPNSVKRRLEAQGGSLWYASLLRSERFDSYEKRGTAIMVSMAKSEIDRSAKLIGTLNDDSSTNEGVQENPLSKHYHQILADPTEAVKAMDDRTAQGLLKIIADYKKSRDK